MASKGRGPPSHLRRPVPSAGVIHPDPFGPPIQPSSFSPFERLPPHEVLEQKFNAQHVEMEKLVTENRRLAATHATLRQDLAAAKHELQLVHAHIEEMKSEREQQMRGLMDKMARMEAELRAAEPIKLESQQARSEAQKLFSARQELIAKVQELTQDLQMAHSEAQQIPVLLSELDGLRQEYQHCRATYDYEKKLYNDHLESLQVMEKNYMTMSREVEKLRAELSGSANFDPRTGRPFSGAAGFNGNIAPGNYALGQSGYGDGYGIPQGQSPLVGGANGGGAAGGSVTRGTSPHIPGQPTSAGLRAASDASRGPGYDALRGPAGARYDAQRGPTAPGFDAQRGPTATGYDAQRGPTAPGYDAQRGPTAPGYDVQRGPTAPGYDVQRGPTAPGYDAQRGPTAPGYDAQRGPTAPGYDSQRGPTAPGYDSQRGPTAPGYDVQRGPTAPGYDAHRGPGVSSYERGPSAPAYEANRGSTQRGPGYDTQKTSSYDPQRGPGYDGQKGSSYDAQRVSGNDVHREASYDLQKTGSSRGTVGPQEQVLPTNNAPYVSVPAPNRTVGGYEAPPRGGNAVHR